MQQNTRYDTTHSRRHIPGTLAVTPLPWWPFLEPNQAFLVWNRPLARDASLLAQAPVLVPDALQPRLLPFRGAANVHHRIRICFHTSGTNGMPSFEDGVGVALVSEYH